MSRGEAIALWLATAVIFLWSVVSPHDLMTWLWWAALALGESADSFPGTQGDVWDTQWDMMLALN